MRKSNSLPAYEALASETGFRGAQAGLELGELDVRWETLSPAYRIKHTSFGALCLRQVVLPRYQVTWHPLGGSKARGIHAKC